MINLGTNNFTGVINKVLAIYVDLCMPALWAHNCKIKFLLSYFRSTNKHTMTCTDINRKSSRTPPPFQVTSESSLILRWPKNVLTGHWLNYINCVFFFGVVPLSLVVMERLVFKWIFVILSEKLYL